MGSRGSEVVVEFTPQAILQRMKDSLHNPVNKIEGGFCMDNLQAVAEELARLFAMEIDLIPDRVFLDTAEGEFLDRKALDYNEKRQENESDESFRERVFQKIQNPLTSGNRNHYIYWAKKVPNVGAAQCIPCWAGPGTVKVIVLSDKKGVPTEETLQSVRNYIEENRPVGAAVTVEAAKPISVKVELTIQLESGYGLENTKAVILQYIQEYANSIAFQELVPLSYYRIGDRIFNAPGVQDILSYTVNGATESLSAQIGEFFHIEEVSVHEIE